MKILWFSLLHLVANISAAKITEPITEPFKSSLVSVWRCENTTYPLEKDPPVQMNMWSSHSGTSRTRLLSFNMTVSKETKNVRSKIKYFKWENSKWVLIYMLEGIKCRGLLLDVFYRAIGFNMFDTSKCAFVKGIFSVNGININKIQHTFTSKMDFGQLLWSYELIVGFSTYQCWEFQTRTERI